MPRSIHATVMPSWTPAHVDHRLNPTNRHVPHLPRYIMGGRILQRGRTNRRQTESSQSNRVLTTTQSSELCTESRATSRGVSRAPPHHRLLPLRRGRNLTTNEPRIALSDPLPNLLHYVVTPQIGWFGIQETFVAGHRALIARTRMNQYVLSVFLSPPEPRETHT